MLVTRRYTFVNLRCLTPILIKNPKYSTSFGKFENGNLVPPPLYVRVPCGKCYACRRNKQNQWVCRILLELLVSRGSLMFVLTYDDEHLPLDYKVNKKHVQDFLKRLRHEFDFRYFIASEYGSKSGRPHYHCIFFLKEIPKLSHLRSVTTKWQNGSVHFMSTTLASINYSLKYCTKQALFDDKMFALMSRRPGLGSTTTHNDILKCYDKNTNTINVFGNRFNLPRYLRIKFDIPLDSEVLDAFYYGQDVVSDFLDANGNIDYRRYNSAITVREYKLKQIKDKI
ncbi:replication initiator protein [Microvirus mar1]|uniref:Replication initiator protein n=1 Tax=Microvirus mar1 TaxID=2851141 RepID=A0A8F5MK05_9VIRU|nr:replication initiator protein [Microvirus mar1]